jgi:hypothetical protein
MSAGLKLWLISQEVNCEYDTYDSAVVIAADEEAARAIHPSGYVWREGAWRYADPSRTHKPETFSSSWATPENVKAVVIGSPASDLAAGEVVCASFNAG